MAEDEESMFPICSTTKQSLIKLEIFFMVVKGRWHGFYFGMFVAAPGIYQVRAHASSRILQTLIFDHTDSFTRSFHGRVQLLQRHNLNSFQISRGNRQGSEWQSNM
ncbi:uncharacterized protein MCYG_01667 [Microsporum canis CBS 113480]|uniref:Uncharacterized protein n=1 Tax=Arthroderma otae (strain ATCC MYA-4605 / CBS 113480) TaxID=554155 RepID=C5FHC9_ARTOC|nr:uncharacterized protein MCYG_01667 [Microsporum canis CBS 113480]EEQ28848.1 predicted protein [Microsporum canis CBS 113480]